jgi:chromosome segregation ATPase
VSHNLDVLGVLADVPVPIWAALSGGLSAVGTWVFGMKRLSVAAERVRLKTTADALTEEISDRSAFRVTLMAEISSLRQRVKECEAQRDDLQNRVNVAEGQTLILKASNDILARWVKFFKDRNSQDAAATTSPSDIPTVG